MIQDVAADTEVEDDTNDNLANSERSDKKNRLVK